MGGLHKKKWMFQQQNIFENCCVFCLFVYLLFFFPQNLKENVLIFLFFFQPSTFNEKKMC